MARETLHSDFAKTSEFRYADLQWFVVGIVDPSGKGRWLCHHLLATRR
jgi:hypothetical protein